MQKLNIVGIKIDNRDDHAAEVQKVLTTYGNKIIGRFGVPTQDKNNGLIAIVMEAETNDIQHLANDLHNIDGVEINSMNV